MLRPGGGAAVGRAAGGGTPCLPTKVNCCSSSDGCFFANTTPGSSDVNLAQNKHNGVDYPYSKILIMQKDNIMTDHYFKLEIWKVYH